MRFARTVPDLKGVETIVETIEVEGDIADFYAPEFVAGLVDLEDQPDATVGWIRDGSDFVDPADVEPDLDEAKAAKRAAVNVRRDQIAGGGYQHNFGGSVGIRTLDTRNEGDAINWLGLERRADRFIAAGAGSTPLPIRDASDNTFLSSANTVQTALFGMAEWRGEVMQAAWELKDKIEAAVDVAAVNSIDVDFGWPD